MVEPKTVSGKIAKHDVMLYTISTCIWCRLLKSKLNDNNIQYKYIDIDLVTGPEKDQIRAKLRKFQSQLAFPMMFIDEEFISNELIDQEIAELVQEG